MWYEIEITGVCDLGWTTMSSDYYTSSGSNDLLTVTVGVPEPLTLALLGLGAIALRRRKI